MNWKKKILEFFGLGIVESKHRQHWSEDEKKAVKGFRYRYALNDEEIGKKIGRTERAVRQMRYREGIV